MIEVLQTIIAPALLDLFHPTHLAHLVLGVVAGLAIGILPGLGGIAGMALILPFVYGMDPTSALAMMIGLTAVTNTSDTFPSILMGIPGSASGQATVVDGYPLAQKGEAARALSASFSASLVGGLIGALILTFAIFLARPLLLLIGFGEQLLLLILALVLVGMLTGPSMAKGLAACGLGLLLGTVGEATATAEYRMIFGSSYLLDGLPLVPLGLGMFALPEIIDALRFRERIAEGGRLGRGWLAGLRDSWIHRWLIVRCSGLGALFGAAPGVGGVVIDWLAYGHAVQTARDRSQFGKGDIRGVIAPESANNAKDGGALIPVLLLSIPSSGTMALFLAGMTMIGVQPGRQLVETNMPLVFVIIWSLALANVVGAGICVALAAPIARLTTLRYVLVAPFLIVIVFLAAYEANEEWGDIVVLAMIGLLAILMKRFGWSRPALLIGFVLSNDLEAAFYRTAQIYGLDLLARPLALVLIAIVAVLAFAQFRGRRRATIETEGPRAAWREGSRRPQLFFTACLAIAPAVALAEVWNLRFLGQVFPLVIACITALLLLTVLLQLALASPDAPVIFDAEAGRRAPHGHGLGSGLALFAGLPALTAILGFELAVPIFVALVLALRGGVRWAASLVGGVAALAVVEVGRHVLGFRLPQGLLLHTATGWWFGG